MRLKNKTVIITGGGTGIGRACTGLFCSEGATCVIFGRRKDRLEEAAAEIGANVIVVPGDVTQEGDVDRLVQAALGVNGNIDVLVNNAGIFSGGPLHEMESAQWDQILDINLRGVFLLTQKVLKHMVKRKSGNIIHISSILGMVAFSETAAYNASKGALNQLSRTIAVEYGPLGVRSNAICPGMIETDMTEELRQNTEMMKELIKAYPLGHFGKPDDIAQACLFLASEESSFVTGAVLPVDGGYTAH